jgi:hypothetical protein
MKIASLDSSSLSKSLAIWIVVVRHRELDDPGAQAG